STRVGKTVPTTISESIRLSLSSKYKATRWQRNGPSATSRADGGRNAWQETRERPHPESSRRLTVTSGWPMPDTTHSPSTARNEFVARSPRIPDTSCLPALGPRNVSHISPADSCATTWGRTSGDGPLHVPGPPYIAV